MGIREFSDEFKLALGENVLKTRRIYLDTRFWIHMREASLGQAIPEHQVIYDRLKMLSQAEKIICPLSPHVFSELMKIGDEDRRLQTAQVMDELSQQVTFMSPLSIAGQELLCFIRNCEQKIKGKRIYNSAKYVWTSTPLVMGEFYPYIQQLTSKENEKIQVEFFKFLSTLSLVEMVKKLKDFPTHDRSSLIINLNKGKDENTNFKSFQDVFMQEVIGILQVLEEDMQEVLRFIYYEDEKKFVSQADIKRTEYIGTLQRIIYNAFKLNKIGTDLPFIHIQASLYAFFRYNKSQRFKENDLTDISHATWALPYCDAFFTERRLANWLCHPPLNLNQVYKSAVYYQEKDIVDYLDRIDMGSKDYA